MQDGAVCLEARCGADGAARHLQVARSGTGGLIGDQPAECGQDRSVGRCDESVAVRRDVQQEGGVAADGLLVDGEELLGAADGSVLSVVVEPAGADGGVHLGRVPDQVVGVVRDRGPAAEVLVVAADQFGEGAVVGLLGPFGCSFGVAELAGDDAPLVGRVCPASLPHQRTSGPHTLITAFGCSSRTSAKYRSQSYVWRRPFGPSPFAPSSQTVNTSPYP